ncbi:MAG: ferrous iron transport protein A [Phycisphaeraceae bacterium]|nr:ferrous iron transport protein A [Phycisphaeraceae bacterium]
MSVPMNTPPPGCVAEPPTGPTSSLDSLRPGEISHVASLGVDDPGDAALLRAMGLRPGIRVKVVRLGEPTILEVLGAEACGCACASRIGLTKALASRVRVAASGVTGPEKAR